MKSVEMHLAFLWDCPACDYENIARVIIPENLEMLPQALLDDLERILDDEDYGKPVMLPVTVICRDCRKRFKASYAENGAVDGEDDDPDQ